MVSLDYIRRRPVVENVSTYIVLNLTEPAEGGVGGRRNYFTINLYVKVMWPGVVSFSRSMNVLPGESKPSNVSDQVILSSLLSIQWSAPMSFIRLFAFQFAVSHIHLSYTSIFWLQCSDENKEIAFSRFRRGSLRQRYIIRIFCNYSSSDGTRPKIVLEKHWKKKKINKCRTEQTKVLK